MDLVTLDDLKSWLGIDAGDDSQDPQLTIALEGSEDLVQSLLGRDLAEASRTERVDGLGDDTVYVSSYPITQVTDVTIDERTSTFGLTTLGAAASDPDASDLTTDRSGGVTRLDGGIFPDGDLNVLVEYTGGYTPSSLPADLKLLILQVAALHIHRRGKEGIQSESLDGFSYQLRSPTEGDILGLEGAAGVLSRYQTIAA